MISEQTELIRSLRLIIDEKSCHEKALQEQVDYLTKKLFGSSSERQSDDNPGQQSLFDEAEMEQDPALLEEETVIREHTRKKMAKAHDLNIYGYLKFLLEQRPTKDMTDEQLAELAPWSEKLQSIKNRM